MVSGARWYAVRDAWRVVHGEQVRGEVVRSDNYAVHAVAAPLRGEFLLGVLSSFTTYCYTRLHTATHGWLR